jgi:hypothetical protein
VVCSQSSRWTIKRYSGLSTCSSIFLFAHALDQDLAQDRTELGVIFKTGQAIDVVCFQL